MAMSGGSDDGEPMMEMNTTPLIDVMLVLLIMLMITIPPTTHAVDIDLPTDQPPHDPPPKKPLINIISVAPTGTVLWNSEEVSLEQLMQSLQQSKTIVPLPELRIQPDPSAPYDSVDKVIKVVKLSKVKGFGFVGNENYLTFTKSPVDGQGRPAQ